VTENSDQFLLVLNITFLTMEAVMNFQLKACKLGIFSITLCSMLISGQVAADILCRAANPNIITGAGTAPTAVMSTTFVTTVANQAVAFLYNAECEIAGEPHTWLNSDIVIDPAGAAAPFVCSPSASDNALCSGNGATSVNSRSWISAATHCVATIPTAGTHSVRARVTPVPAGTAWRIDDQSLICIN
jgi:hypothetical protein